MKKRIRVTIEWEGPHSEERFAEATTKALENCDPAGLTKVTAVECFTSIGETEGRELTELEEARRCRNVGDLVARAEELVDGYYSENFKG